MSKTLPTLAALLAIATAACDASEPAAQTPPASDTVSRVEASAAPGAAPVAERATEAPADSATEAAAFDPRNAGFALEGRRVVLRDGVALAAAAPGSASVAATRYLGLEARGDLTRDGREDLAYFVTHESGGSGRFHYVVVAINAPGGYNTTNAFLVGDRVQPQSLRIVSNELQVNFLGRARGEPMTAPASRPSVLLLKVTPGGVLEGLMK